MLDKFLINNSFAQRIEESGHRSTLQISKIIEIGNKLKLDWYFTGIPDLRCGVKEISRKRALSVCLRV